MSEDPYELLGVGRDADADEIKRAYRRRAQEHHPDKLGELDENARRDADGRMQRINRAYDQLTDEASRARLDDRMRRADARRVLRAVVWGTVAVLVALVVVLRWPRRVGGAVSDAEIHGRATRAPRSRQALAALIQATEDHPRDARAWDRRWRGELAAGRTADAARSLLRAVQLDSGNVDLHEERARLAVAQGDTAAAAEELTWLRANGFGARADAAARK